MIREDAQIKSRGKSVLVTGSSRGIGKSIALRLAREGFDIIVHCRTNVVQAMSVCKEVEQLGRMSRLLQFDIGDRVNTKLALESDIETHSIYYGVVCNAGLSKDKAFPSLTSADWDSVVHGNLDGFYNVLHPLVMPLVRRRSPGRIITLSSVSGIIGNRGQVNYSAAKAGIIGATKALAVELGKRAITVNCVAPGLIETEMLGDLLHLEETIKQIPTRRLGKPEEVAALVSFLMSDEAGYITRQVISVNGGMC